jgi:uncharacterized protein (TIGR02391 family)
VNLQTHIPEQLWTVVVGPYESGNYCHAILEGIHLLSATLREKSGVDGDGAALVGAVLGGESPRLRLNSLQTESERSTQKGMEQILRGIFLGIRNPRSHEPIVDDKDTADALLHFLGYILKLLDVSQSAFTSEDFMARVLDPEFVESQRYAELLVAEIPPQRRGEAIVTLYRSRRRPELRKARSLISSLLSQLSEAQLENYLTVVSDDLRTTTDEAAIRTALQMLSPEVWPRLSEVSRLRIETKLISGIRDGEVLAGGKTTSALATWANSFLRAFTLRNQAAEVLLAKLEDSDGDDRAYVVKFFMRQLPDVLTSDAQVDRCVRALAQAVKNGDDHVREALVTWIRGYPASWQEALATALQEETDPQNPAVMLSNGTPFLSSPTKNEDSDDDFPF